MSFYYSNDACHVHMAGVQDGNTVTISGGGQMKSGSRLVEARTGGGSVADTRQMGGGQTMSMQKQ